MRYTFLLLSLLLLCLPMAEAMPTLSSTVVASSPSPTSFGQARPLLDGWFFNIIDDSAAVSATYDDSRWERVLLPHDWSAQQPMSAQCGSCQGYLPGGIGWYRRQLTVSASDLEDGRRLYVYFEGVYNRSTVYVNGHRLGHRPSGFASFLYDLTPSLHVGTDNLLAVRVDHSRQNDSRWYTGSGINRPVWLISAPSTHFALWGTSWATPTITADEAIVCVHFATTTPPPLSRLSPAACPANHSLSAVVEILDATETIVATASVPALVTAHTTADAAIHATNDSVTLAIPHPHRWSLSDPYLYKVRVRLFADGRETDISEVPLGLRTLCFSPDRGFALNEEWTKVKGVCLHDDAGILGTAVPSAVWKRRLLALKQLGTNAIRMSHNPHQPSLYDLCDSIGLLVMDEAFDEWEFPKRKWLQGWNKGTPGMEGSYDYFDQWCERDLADMVMRDQCHPSIFLWSIGNEVDYPNDPYSHPVLNGNGRDFTQPAYGGYKPEQPHAERIGDIAQRLAKVVREHTTDHSRAVTGALAGVVMSNETAYPEAVDVVGYNYTESRYAEDHRRYPQRIIYGSENRHDLPAWQAVRDNAHIFGQFLWTGIDYLGESGPWPARGSEAGLLDLSGQVKPIGHYRAALWAENPVCYLGTYLSDAPNRRRYRGLERSEWVSPYAPARWNYDEGQHVRVVCYTNATSAQLFLNDAPIGGEPRRDASTDILYWDVVYHPGTLRCIASNEATASIVTAGQPAAIRAAVWEAPHTDAASIIQVEVEIVDENGNVVPLADNELTCTIKGQLQLLGMENGDIRDVRDKGCNSCRVHGGRLVAYLAYTATEETYSTNATYDGRSSMPAMATVTFASPSLPSTTLTLPLANEHH